LSNRFKKCRLAEPVDAPVDTPVDRRLQIHVPVCFQQFQPPFKLFLYGGASMASAMGEPPFDIAKRGRKSCVVCVVFENST